MTLAEAASSSQQLEEELEKVFPAAKGSAKRAKPLKDLFASLFPGSASQVGIALRTASVSSYPHTVLTTTPAAI